jgi:cytidylate kinase
MDRPPIRIITISREYGAGGSSLAIALGEHLNWPVLDRDLAHRVAARLRIDDATAERLDEHPPSFAARVAAAMLVTPLDAPVTFDLAQLLDPDDVAHAAQATIVDAAKSPPLIIVGHGAQCILRNRDDACHLRLVAPLPVRVTVLREREPGDDATLGAHAQRMDTDRAKYVMRYYNSDIRDPTLYSLTINTGAVTTAEAARIVTEMVRSRTSE